MEFVWIAVIAIIIILFLALFFTFVPVALWISAPCRRREGRHRQPDRHAAAPRRPVPDRQPHDQSLESRAGREHQQPGSALSLPAATWTVSSIP